MQVLGLTNTIHAPEKGLWLCGDEAGRSRQVLELDGTNDHVITGFFDDLEGANSFTLGMRFRLNGAQASATKLFHHGDSIFNTPFILMQLITSGGDQHIRLNWFHGSQQSQMNSVPDFTSGANQYICCLLYTSPSPRDGLLSRMPSSG